MPYGVNDNGFNIKSFNVILSEIKAKLQSDFPDLAMTDDTVEGQFLTIASDKFAELWEALQAVYNSSGILTAEGNSFDNLLALNNMTRRSASKSRIPNVVITGAPGAVVAAGMKCYSSSNVSLIFETIASYTFNSEGVAIIDVYCTVDGPNIININSLDTVLNASVHINSITNPQSIIAGTDMETIPEVLMRRITQINNAVGGTEAGITTAIEQLNTALDTTINYIKVISNRTSQTDGVGRPPHTFEVVVSDTSTYSMLQENVAITTGSTIITILGVDAIAQFTSGTTIAIDSNYNSQGKEKFTVRSSNYVAPNTIVYLNSAIKASNATTTIYNVTGPEILIANAIWNAQSTVESVGTIAIDILDVDNNTHVVKFSHPGTVNIVLNVTLTTSTALSTAEIINLKQNIVDWGNSLPIGKDVIIFGYNCLAAQFNNSKITDIVINISGNGINYGDNNVPVSNGSLSEVQYTIWNFDNITVNQ